MRRPAHWVEESILGQALKRQGSLTFIQIRLAQNITATFTQVEPIYAAFLSQKLKEDG